jgi:hypothetical protein
MNRSYFETLSASPDHSARPQGGINLKACPTKSGRGIRQRTFPECFPFEGGGKVEVNL